MTAPSAGMRLGSRYRLVRQIAVGGMGEVWVAHDDSLARDIAVKVLRAEFAGNDEFLGRLRTEARNAASLSHQNIAQLYDYGEQDGLGFLVMELIAGEPMSDLLERSPVLGLDRLLPILSQTARALHAAHVSGVVHRDVKPGNILLERSGRVKITDFGVSLAANQIPMTATGMVMGTAQYLSPEQAVGRQATAASDVYALGIIAYESLVGRRPFTGKTPVEIAVAHVNQEVPPMPSSVPPDISALVMRMLAKDPTERPRSAAQLAATMDDLEERYREQPWLGTVGATRSEGSDSHRKSPGGPAPEARSPGSGPRPTSRPRPGGPGSADRRATGTPPAGRPLGEAPAGASPSRSAQGHARPARSGERSGTRTNRGSRQHASSRAAGRSRRSIPTVASHQSRGRGRQSTTTGRRLKRFSRVSWQAAALILLVAAVVVMAIVGLFTDRQDSSTAASTQPYRGVSVSRICPHARQSAHECPSGLSAPPQPAADHGSVTTTLKDV